MSFSERSAWRQRPFFFSSRTVVRVGALLLSACLLAAPTAGCAQPASATASGVQQRHEKPINLNFSQIDLRVLLRVIADYSGKKMAIAPGIGGPVEAHYAAPWDQVLEQIAKKHSLVITVHGNEINVSKAAP